MSKGDMTRVNRDRSRTGGGNGGNGKGKPKPKKKKRLTKKRVLWTMFFATALAIFCALGGYLFIMFNGEKLLAENGDKLTINPPTQVFDRNGTKIAEFALEKSDPVEYDDIPEMLRNAFIATEDRRFMEHKGIDFWSIGRAAVKDIMARSLVEGGSTITQQLAKNIFLTRDKTFFRKATEMSIAVALENKLSKEEILAMYLNRINFAGTTYGVKAASIRYFGKSNLNDLELWEMATLAGMPQAPSRYNPLRNPEFSKQRRSVVLQLMYDQNLITEQEMNQAKAVDYNYKPPETKQRYQAFIDYVIDEAEDKFGLTEDDLNVGGYKIYTTMDAQAQSTVEAAFENADNFEEGVDDQIVQGSMAIINQENGSIVALSGGRNYERKGFSRVTDAKRSPGSAFKPIISYAPALESGKFNMNDMLSNEKQCFGQYCPSNLHGYSTSISMGDAITKSENIPAVWLLNEIGVGTGYDFAKRLGISLGDNDRNLSLALGGMESGTNTLEMAQAYSAFAAGGEMRDAYSIKSIVNSSDETVFKANLTPERVMSERTAAQMTQMMQRVVEDGTGRRAKIDRPVAGKTGTTQSGYSGISQNRDVWFVGYTPEWTAAVWMGYDNPSRTHLLKNSSGLAAEFWAKVMQEALKDIPRKEFLSYEGDAEPTPTPTPEALQSIAGFTAQYNPDTMTVNMNWQPAEQEDAQYLVYRKEASEADYSVILTTMSPGADDLSAMPGSAYNYYVTAYFPELNQESPPSDIVHVEIEDEMDEPGMTDDPALQTPDPDDSGDSGEGNGPGQGEGPGNNGNEGNGEQGNNGNGNNGNNGNQGNNGNGNPGGSGEGSGGQTTAPTPAPTPTPPPAFTEPPQDGDNTEQINGTPVEEETETGSPQ